MPTTLTLGEITRGSGKVFVRVHTNANRLWASSSAGGNDLPCEAFRLDDGDWVVTVPVLSVTQRLDVWAGEQDADKHARMRINPLAARVQSTANTLRKNEAATGIRNIDAELSSISLEAKSIVPDGDQIIVTCTVDAFPKPVGHEQMSPAIFALDGTRVDDGWIDLGTHLRPDAKYPSEKRFSSTFSLRVPAGLDALVIGVDFADQWRFIELEPWRLAQLRDQWAQLATPADRDVRYEDWFLNRHRMRKNDRILQERAVPHLAEQPTFSIIVPLFKTPLDFFAEMVDSVVAQTYPNWELLLVNASPEDGALHAAVEQRCAADKRIRHIPLDGNYGITENTNAGIRAATGDFLSFFDHDDVLEPDILYWYAKGISDYPTTDLLYCDEDHLQDGHYIVPFLKPDWDPDLLCSENYVCHMLTVRKSLVDALPELPDKRFDGSQDHNMTFLVGEQARNVYHVRRVLYHWRIHENSTAGKGVSQKSYALEAERLAVQGHLDRCGIPAKAVMEARVPGRCEVTYDMHEFPLVSIVIPNKDAPEVLSTCIDSILELTTWPLYEIVVVENNSTQDDTFALYERLQARDRRIRVITSNTGGVFNFSKVINDGFAAASGEYLLMLNNDTEVIDADWLQHLMGPCMREDVGAVGCKLLYANDTFQHVGVALGRGFGPFHVDVSLPEGTWGYYETDLLSHRASAVTGACLLTKRSVFDEVGGLDETLSVNYNDIDYCMKVQQAGLAVLLQLDTRLRHYESVTRSPSTSRANAISFGREHGIFLGRWQRHVTLGEHYYSKLFRFWNPYHTLDV